MSTRNHPTSLYGHYKKAPTALLLTFLVLFLIRLTKGNDQIKILKNSSVEVKVQTLSLHFLVCLFVSSLFYCFNIPVFILSY